MHYKIDVEEHKETRCICIYRYIHWHSKIV